MSTQLLRKQFRRFNLNPAGAAQLRRAPDFRLIFLSISPRPAPARLSRLRGPDPLRAGRIEGRLPVSI
jgi:hypothetical protein